MFKKLLSKTKTGFLRFMTTPASPRPLAVLRIGLAGVLLLQAFSMAGDVHELFGNRGIVQTPEGESPTGPYMINIDWIASGLESAGFDRGLAVKTVFFSYIGTLVMLLMGYHTRFAAIVAWLMHLAMNASGNAIIYGVDAFAIIALFYCVWMPVGAAWSLDAKRRAEKGTPSDVASVEARIGLRVLQIHMCLVYLTSGIHKAMGIQWWNGEAIWRALNLPSLRDASVSFWNDLHMPAIGNLLSDFTWLASVPFLAMLLCWGTLFVEIGYAFLVWPRKFKMRTMMVWGAIGLHAGIAVGMGLYSFSGVMIVLNLAAFVACSEPKEIDVVETAGVAVPAAA